MNDNYMGSGLWIQKVIDKHKEDRHYIKEILKSDFTSEKELSESERYFIKEYKEAYPETCMNIHEGGLGGNTIKYIDSKRREELHKKLSIQNSGENNPMYGKHHTEETRLKMSRNYDHTLYRVKNPMTDEIKLRDSRHISRLTKKGWILIDKIKL